MKELMIRIENVSKQYRLGQIGGITFKEELQRRSAKRHHREDPTRKIGMPNSWDSELFMAVDGVSFEVEKGERIGIIGRNGAGKSTLLKLISRITSPTTGDIWLNGRVASLLEVGTGFNAELTGRENIYMNGAILGMSKKEIDSKIEDIIDFSECRPFIDTPVKRYSSGMNVKLGFAVAAYLDCEIMIMDEVLAVGDMAFQQKCLRKMDEVSRDEGRTILYVSHNMNTIRQLCDRCIVLDHGKLVFDGDTDEAIGIYMGARVKSGNEISLVDLPRTGKDLSGQAVLTSLECIHGDTNVFDAGDTMDLKIGCTAREDTDDIHLRIIVRDTDGRAITMMTTDKGIHLEEGKETVLSFALDVSALTPGNYTISPGLYRLDGAGTETRLDHLNNVYWFEVRTVPGFNNGMNWKRRAWGYFWNPPIEVNSEEVRDTETDSVHE